MAEIAVSATETALENQRIGALQIRVVALCTLIQMCDGYDISAIGWAVPSLTHAWNMPGPAFTHRLPVVECRHPGRRAGRRADRRPLRAQAAAAGQHRAVRPRLAAQRLCRLLPILAVLRFFTGLGIGGAFAGTVALTGDYTPQRRRATDDHGDLHRRAARRVSGRPDRRAAAAGIRLASRSLCSAASFPLVLLPILALWLPESPRFLAAKSGAVAAPGGAAARLDIVPGASRPALDIAARQPGPDAVRRGLRAADRADVDHLLLQPDELVPVRLLDAGGPAPDRHDAGRRRSSPRASANWARSSRCSISALLIDRFGPERALGVNYAAGVVFIALIALVAMPYAAAGDGSSCPA